MGPWRIGMSLRRYHEIVIGDSTIYRILRRHSLNRLPQNQAHKPQHQKWRRYEKPLPGHRLQIDAKFLEAIPGKRSSYWQFTAIDDCTRLRVLKIYQRNNQKNAIEFVDYVLSRLPFRVQAIQTANVADGIVGIAEKEGADLIVSATHGLSGWRHFVFGSVAEKVLRLARCSSSTRPRTQRINRR